MKKSIAALGFFAASFVLVTILGCAEANAQILDQGPSFRDLAIKLQTPEDVAHYMWRHFQFEDDRSNFGRDDHWQKPEEFLTTQKGDCEDFALFAREVLKMQGIKCFLLNVYGKRFAHTVCVFKENGKYNVIDGTNVFRFQAGDIKSLLGKIYPFWDTGSIVEPAPSSDYGQILTQFERQAKIKQQMPIAA